MYTRGLFSLSVSQPTHIKGKEDAAEVRERRREQCLEMGQGQPVMHRVHRGFRGRPHKGDNRGQRMPMDRIKKPGEG